MANKTRTQANQEAFMEAFFHNGNIAKSCKMAGYSKENHYKLIQNEPDYKKKFEATKQRRLKELPERVREFYEQREEEIGKAIDELIAKRDVKTVLHCAEKIFPTPKQSEIKLDNQHGMCNEIPFLNNNKEDN